MHIYGTSKSHKMGSTSNSLKIIGKQLRTVLFKQSITSNISDI